METNLLTPPAYAGAAKDDCGPYDSDAILVDDLRLQRLTTLAIDSVGAEIGGISLIYRDQIWLPSHVGPYRNVISRAGSLCCCALRSSQPTFEIADAIADGRFAANPLVSVSEFRHYAGIALSCNGNQLKGMLWVMKSEAGALDEAQWRTLRSIAALATETLEVRYCDEITGMYNRTFFINQLQNLIDSARRPVVGYIDVKAFEQVCETYGQAAGEELLNNVGRRLLLWAGDDAIVSHLHADRFAFAVLGNGEDVARRIREIEAALALPVYFRAGRTYPLRPHIGVTQGAAYAPAHAVTLLQEACSAAIAGGRQTASWYDRAMRDEGQLLGELTDTLRGAADYGHLEMHYQPQVDLACGRLIGWEALVRWQHPVHGLLFPGKFIPLAEKAGEIGALDKCVMRLVCADLKRWLDQGLDVPPVALNFARETLFEASFAAKCKEALSDYGVPGQLLECEVTESQCCNSAILQERLAGLRALGMRISIDDFGTGYANLDTLHQLSFDRIKVDRQFVQGVSRDARTAGLLGLIRGIAQQFDVEVLCEGVETASDAAWLTANGLPNVQGWHISAALGHTAAATAMHRVRTHGAVARHEDWIALFTS